MILRVLHVVTYMGRGGLETMLMNYYRNIDRNRLQFDFLVHREFEADYDQEIISLGGRIYRLPKLNPFSLDYCKKIDEFFANHKEYKIVHSHLDCMAGIPLKYAKKHGVPIRIAHAHNSNQTKDKKYLLKLMYKKNICKYADILYACGYDAGKWMFGTDNFSILNNAIDSKRYSYNAENRKKIRKELKIPLDALVVGHVGRFSPQKNHEYLIQIFFETQKKKDNIFLLLVGDGELREEISKKVKIMGISNKVVFAGIRDDVEDVLQAMDIFLFPSIYEGLPVSIIEAQAAGLPCLISDKVPIDCKITDCVQQIALNADIEKWVKALLLNSKKQRIDRYKEVCASGYDIKKNAKELENAYMKMLKERGKHL